MALVRAAQRLAADETRAQLLRAEAASESGGDADPAALAAFFQEQGLREREVADALSACGGGSGGGGPRLSRPQLEARWAALRRILPGADVAAMVAREPRVLTVDGGDLAARLVALAAAFPAADAVAMAQKRPGVLLLEVCARAASAIGLPGRSGAGRSRCVSLP